MSSDNGLTFEEENNAPMCKECGGGGCPDCLGYGYMSGISDETYYPSDYEPSYYEYDNDDDDYEYPWGDDFDHDNGYYYDDEPVTERLTIRGRWYIFRWFTFPDFIARVKWRFWYSKMRLKSKIYRLTHRNPFDDIPF